MVGVPGRSKGCKTCRRRKKGCDLKRPECGQCTERGLVCGGYDRDRVFINHSAGATRAPNTEIQSKPRSRQTSLESLLPGYPCPENASFESSPRSSASPICSPPSLARSAYNEKSLEVYLDYYLPNDSLDRSLLSNQGIAGVIGVLYVRDRALRSSLVALTSAVTGQAMGNRALMEQGKRLYGWSLCELTKALADPRRASDDALLAVPRVMGLFEILFGADLKLNVQASSWHSHAAGDLALMKAKGPAAFRHGVSHKMFLDGRLNPIIMGIGTRKATPLNLPEWKTIPWDGKVKTPKDTLIDVLAAIPELLELQDRLVICPDEERESRIDVLSTKFQNVELELDAWIAQNEMCICEPETEEPTPINFPDFVTAHLTVLYWATCVTLYQAMVDFSARLSVSPSLLLPPRSPWKKHPRRYARLVARAVPYFFRPKAGIMSAVLIAFPMGTSLLSFRTDAQPEDALYRALIIKSWMDPKLPTSIKAFLLSMREENNKIRRRAVTKTS